MLNGTTAQIRERTALRVNPAKTCQPIGAMYAALGIHGCMPHSHGSQGCCAYHRSQLTRHLKEPIVATTSSFTEGASVFGGLANLQQALENIFTIYKPEIVAVHTTCLSEVIGDDIPMIVERMRNDGKLKPEQLVMHVNTPSFKGSHITGFSGQCEAAVKYFSASSGTPRNYVNIFPGWVDPADMREVKHLARELGLNFILFPDTSDVLDLPQTGHYQMYPDGGTTVAEIRALGDSTQTIALGPTCSTAAAALLEKKCNVASRILDLPYGLSNTDKFIDALRLAGDVSVPKSIEYERGRLIDMMSDMGQYFHNKRVALVGDPDQLTALTQFLVELDMTPAIVITGSPSKGFEETIKKICAEKNADVEVRTNSDMHYMHQWMKNHPVDILIGNTYAKLVARAEGNMPYVRFGFPILDRMGHRCFPTVGYMGAMRLMEKISDSLLDYSERNGPDEKVELIL
jgi:nitrogenase molybdenum-iron protein beta chain